MPSAPPPKKPKDGWNMRIWFGCDLFAWLRLLSLGRFRVGWRQLRLLPTGTLLTAINTFLRYAQDGLYGRRIRETVVQPPLFILGHWRSGTTLLHELLVQDPRHGFPDTLQCMAPSVHLVTGHLLRRYFNWVLPARRTIDNMAVGWGRPQEDEFALAILGAPSPYASIAFPNAGPLDAEALDLDSLPARRREKWKRVLLWFLKSVAIGDGRRLVLKSPPHTCRIPALLELFPEARFVYIVRDPYAVYPSTINLWKTLHRLQSLQTPTFDGLEQRVFDTFNHFHRRVEATRGLVPAGRFHELRYEDLTKDPVGQLRRLYEQLDLGDFEEARPHVERYLVETSGYERNRWTLSDEQRAEIERHWGEVIRKYGYG
jgi:hypothetical protein